ncbi:DUF6056 family protein [Pseudomonas nicosulfuronedens]
MIELEKIKRISSVFAFTAVLFYLVIFSISPLMGEDYGLSRRFVQEGLIERITWAMHRSHDQITHWNARLGEQIAIFSLSLPDIYFIITASTCFIVLFSAIAIISSENFRQDFIFKISITLSLVFMLWPGMEVFFWRTANAGYLQPMMLTFLALLPWMQDGLISKITERPSLLLLYCCLCVLVGLSFENVPVAVIAVMLGVFFLHERKNLLSLLPIGATLAGWLILLNTPSTTYRTNHYRTSMKIPELSVDYLLSRAIDVCQVFFESSWAIFTAALTALVYLAIARKINKRIFILIISSILVVGSMCASPYTEARGFFYAWCVMYSVIAAAIYHILKSSSKARIAILPLYVISICYAAYALAIYQNHAARLNARTNYIIDHIGREPCTSGVKIRILNDEHGYKYINNRDEWFFYNMINTDKYFGCKIINI